VSENFDKTYYTNNGQVDDRPALGWYKRLARKHLNTSHILDFGCGTGTLMSRLEELGQIDGFETSEFALTQAKLRNPASVLYEEIEALPAETFSAIVSIHVVEHLLPSELNRALEILARSLKTNGRLMIVTPQFEGFAHKHLGSRWEGFTDSTHCNLMRLNEIREILSQHGFVPIREYTDGPWNGPYFTSLKIEKLLFQIPCALQVLTGLKLMPVGFGESYVGIWQYSKG
jgi:SAM-dependent methyltransferase